MKKIPLTITIAILAYYSYAQTNTFPSSGNVGVGTTSPVNALTVVGNQTTNPGSTATFSSNLGSANANAVQVNITNTTSSWGLLAGFDGPNVWTNYSNYYYHGPNYGFLINVQNAPLILGTNNAANMTILPSGYVGIGTTNPISPLNLGGGGNPNPNTGSQIDYGGLNLTFTGYNAGGTFNLGTIKMVQPTGYYVDHADMVFYTAPGGGSNTEKMRITGGGNVLIGRTGQLNTTYMLDVNGPAHATSIVVNSNGADFVFHPSYRLKSLSYIEKYINLNHHLPEIPSARQIKVEGLNLGDNQIKLLQKIEEMTLYLIENDKKNKEQQTQLDQQNQKILDDEQRIKLLETKLNELLKKQN